MFAFGFKWVPIAVVVQVAAMFSSSYALQAQSSTADSLTYARLSDGL